jgi:hypothetical protein
VIAILFGGILAIISCLLLLFFSHSYTSLLLLQNSDELRATGGFLGSVVFVTHHGLTIDEFDFIDIYDLDQQISLFPSAPAGIRDYLSGGQDALHLQDANWERDFPLSAIQITDLIQAAAQKKPDFVIALNSSLIENYLTTFGDFILTIDDGDLILTSDNFSTQARADHELFNPDKKPKTVFLQNFAHQLLTKISHLSWPEKISFSNFIAQQLSQRQLQVFAFHPLYQFVFDTFGLSGRTRQSVTCHNLYFIESNVGINKSNHYTTSELTLTTQSNHQAQLQVIFQNNNPLDETALITKRLHYANYQRLLLPPSVEATNLTFNEEPIIQKDERLLTDSSGNQWREIGFLLNMREQSTNTFTATLQGEKNCFQVFR